MRIKIPILTLRSKLFRAVIALTLALAAASTVHAWTITATGVIIQYLDDFGLFGTPSGPLNYSLTIITDPYLNGGQGLDTVSQAYA